MRRFKIYWVILCFIILFVGTGLLFWYHSLNPSEIANLINMGLGIIAIFSSFVAIMIADLRLPKIHTRLGVWSPSNELVANDRNMVVFKITNKSKQVIDDLVVLMNIPSEFDLYFGGGYKTSSADSHEQAETKILTFKQFEYLDSEGEHSNLEIRIGFTLDNWVQQRVIYLSVLGNKMTSQRFKLTLEDVNGIKEANSAYPFIIKPLK